MGSGLDPNPEAAGSTRETVVAHTFIRILLCRLSLLSALISLIVIMILPPALCTRYRQAIDAMPPRHAQSSSSAAAAAAAAAPSSSSARGSAKRGRSASPDGGSRFEYHDLPKPAGARTAALIYMQDANLKLKANSSSDAGGGAAAMSADTQGTTVPSRKQQAGLMWKGLSEEEKVPWQDLASAEAQASRQELSAWRARLARQCLVIGQVEDARGPSHRLPRSKADATNVAAAFSQLGWYTNPKLDLSFDAMTETIDEFVRGIQHARDQEGVSVTDVVIYFSGHSGSELSTVQARDSDGRPKKPKKADIEKRHSVAKLQTTDGHLYELDIEQLMASIGLDRKMTTVGFILDGYRNHLGKSASNGVSPTDQPLPSIVNGFIGYSTQPGATANVILDGYSNAVNSAYTQAFLHHIHAQPEMNRLFRAVCIEIGNASHQAQVPWYHESIQKMDYSFHPPHG